MTQQADTSTAQQTPAAPTTFEQRLAAVHDEIRAEQPATSQAAADSAAADPAPPDASAAVGSPAASEDAQTKARAERQARLDALKAQERDKVDAKAKLAEADRLARELEAERKTRAELEARAQSLVDVSKLDPAAFFDLAKRANVDPKTLGEWIKDAIANPERIATQAAAQAMDPKLSALQKQIEEQAKLIAQMNAEREQERMTVQQHHMTEQFIGFVGQCAEQSPLAAAMLAQNGREEFLKIADMVGQQLPRGAGPQALLDGIENFLDGDGRAYAQKLASMYGLVQATPSNGTSTPPKTAAAKATTKTVSNSLAQERASVVAETEWARLPFEERLARLKAG